MLLVLTRIALVYADNENQLGFRQEWDMSQETIIIEILFSLS